MVEEETLSHQLFTTIQDALREPEQNSAERPAAEPSAAEQRILSCEEERVAGIEEPMTLLVSSADQTRHLLTIFKQQLPNLRRHRVRL